MAAWRFALLSICLMQALAFSQADHERRLLQAPAPAPVVAPAPNAPLPPGACLGDFSFNVLPQNQVQTLLSSCNVGGVTTASKDCCENIQFLGLALLALNSQSNSNIYAITSDTPAGQNIACVNDFKTNILAPNSVNIPSDVNTFCAPYNVEVFPNIETTLQGSACPVKDAQAVEVAVDLNALASVCYGPSSCQLATDQSGLTNCEDAIVLGAKQLATDAANTAQVTACAEVVSARLVQTHFYESYYSLIQDCGNSTSVNALPPVLEFAQSPTNTFSLPPLPPRPPTPAPAPAPKKQSPGPAPGPAPVPAPGPAPGPANSSIPPPPPAALSPPPPPGAAASTSANLGLLVGIVLLIASIL